MFEAIGRGEYEGYTSEYVTFELQKAHEPKQANMLALIEKYGITVLDPQDEAIRLSRLYKVINMKYYLYKEQWYIK
jgi:hypothetical protein